MNAAPERPRDYNQLGKLVVDIATGQVEDDIRPVNEAKRKAGMSGGTARALRLSSRERRQIARDAANARWGKKIAVGQ